MVEINRGNVTDAITIIFIVGLIGAMLYSGTIHPFRVVLTDSMQPTLNPGDMVFVKKVRDPSGLKVGDIVVYTRPDFKTPIIHRIIGKKVVNGEVCFVIKGDNNPVPDPPYWDEHGHMYPCVPGKAIIAKYVFKIPKLGKPFLWIYKR